MRKILIYVIACVCLLPFITLNAEDERTLPEGMSEEKLIKSVTRQYNYIEKRLLSGKSADKIVASKNTTAIAILNKGRETSAEIATLIEAKDYRKAYFALQDLNKSLKIALKLSRAKDVAKKKSQDEAESARIISDAYYDRAIQYEIDAGYGGEKAYKHFNAAINFRSRASNLETKSEFVEATSLFNQATEALKEAIELASERKSFDLKFKISELRKENDRRMNEARHIGIDKGLAGREARIDYEHGLEKRAEGLDLLDSHDYKVSASLFSESNKLFVSAIKYGKYHLLKKESAEEKETTEKNAEQATFEHE